MVAVVVVVAVVAVVAVEWMGSLVSNSRRISSHIYSGSRLCGVHLTSALCPGAFCLKTISPVPRPNANRYKDNHKLIQTTLA